MRQVRLSLTLDMVVDIRLSTAPVTAGLITRTWSFPAEGGVRTVRLTHHTVTGPQVPATVWSYLPGPKVDRPRRSRHCGPRVGAGVGVPASAAAHSTAAQFP
jgi:hypothetical protein